MSYLNCRRVTFPFTCFFLHDLTSVINFPIFHSQFLSCSLADSAYHRVSSLLRTLSTSFKSYQKIVVAELTSIARKLCESSTSDIEEMAGRKPSSTREASGFSLGGGGLRVLHALAGSLPGDSDRPFALVRIRLRESLNYFHQSL